MWKYYSSSQKKRLSVEKSQYFNQKNIHASPEIVKIVLIAQAPNLTKLRTLLFCLAGVQLLTKTKPYLVLSKPLGMLKSRGFPLGCKISLNANKGNLFLNFLVENLLTQLDLKKRFVYKKKATETKIKTSVLKALKHIKNNYKENFANSLLKIHIKSKHKHNSIVFLCFHKIPFAEERNK